MAKRTIPIIAFFLILIWVGVSGLFYQDPQTIASSTKTLIVATTPTVTFTTTATDIPTD